VIALSAWPAHVNVATTQSAAFPSKILSAKCQSVRAMLLAFDGRCRISTLTRRGADQGLSKGAEGSGGQMTTGAEYTGDNPLRLAGDIDAALAKYGFGNDYRLFMSIKFFEGELRLIANCLRRAAPQKVARQPRRSTDEVATQEEIEKCLKYLKRSYGSGNVILFRRRAK